MLGWLVPGLSAVGGAVQSYLGSRRRERGYEPSQYEMMLIDAIDKELEAGAPGSVTAPFVRRGKEIQRRYARQPGVSGIESAMQSRFVDAPQSEAVQAWRLGLMRERSALARGAGTYWQDQPLDIGAPLEDIGWALWAATHGKKKKGEGGGYGGYGEYYPQAPYRPGRERSLPPNVYGW